MREARCEYSENFPLFFQHAGRGIRVEVGSLHRSQIIIYGPSLGFLSLMG